MYEASRLYTGILSRLMVKGSNSFTPARNTFTVTVEPFGPRKRRITSSVFIFTPAMTVSFTSMMRSPARMPTFSEGPPDTGWMTKRVSVAILNWIPMPSKFPEGVR